MGKNGNLQETIANSFVVVFYLFFLLLKNYVT